MAKKTTLNNKINLIAKTYAQLIRKHGIPIEKVIVFGSWAKGNAGKESDIDLCLVSPEFGQDEIAELQLLLRQTREVNDSIEPLPINSKDYQTSATPLIAEIRKTGLEVAL